MSLPQFGTPTITHELPEHLVNQGWSLHWDDQGWCYAENTTYGRTRESFPTASRGLKFLFWDIEKLVLEVEQGGNGMVTQFPDGAAVSVTTPEPKENYLTLLSPDLHKINDTYCLLQARYHALGVERDELNFAGVCNGVRFTRALANGVAIYANHGTAAHCPMHGAHEDPAKRLRVYVGTYGDEKVTAVIAAMERWPRYEFVFRDQKRVRTAMNDIFNDVKALVRRYGDSVSAGR